MVATPQISKSVGVRALRHCRFDRVITLCDKVREICPEFPGAPIAAHWSIADPAAAGATDQATYTAFQDVTDGSRAESRCCSLTSTPDK
jgi:protein-tyrosine-phosphatase